MSDATTTPRAATRRAPDAKAISLVLLLCVVWGFQQVAMKGVALDVLPIMQLTIRFALAAVFFAAWVILAEGRRAFSDGSLPSGLLLGFMFSLEFLLVGQALRYTTAAHTIVFLYSAPIFTAMGLQLHPEERLSRLQWLGIAIAFVGIAIAFLGFSTTPSMEMLRGDGLALLGGAFWGFSNVVLRRGQVSHAAAYKTVFYQLGTATILLGGFAIATGQTHVTLNPLSIASLAYQTLIIAVASYLIWFWLLRTYQTSRLMLMSFVTPLFGVLFGAVLMKDVIDAHFAMGALLVVAGVLVINLRLLRS
jgi:drug/metabolite transporter (DMT)-like permease